jgi:glycosyltransferase involved in cell wall biosynthesis
MYKISVIIPVYNVENTISKAFDSIYNQSIDFQDIEVIFVDDCSTDNSLNIIQDYASKYDNVLALSLEENSGYAGKPRNIGIKNASSDYVMFLDPDDQFLSNACEILYNAIKNYNADLVSGNYVKYENNEYSSMN